MGVRGQLLGACGLAIRCIAETSELTGKGRLRRLCLPLTGTCINNTSVMMFKKGSFEIGATVYPVAIKVREGKPSCSTSSSLRESSVLAAQSWLCWVNSLV